MNKKLPKKSFKKTSKIPKPVDMDSDDTDNKQRPTVKQPQKASKTLGCPDNESPLETFPEEPTKNPPATGCTAAASCTRILRSGVRKASNAG